MEQEEAGQPEVADHPQLLVEPGGGLARAPVALLEAVAAEGGQLRIRIRVLRAGVAVAEVLGQVEAEPLGEAPALLDRIRVLAKARRHPLGRGEHVRGVAAPAGLRLVEGLAEPDRHHGVLERDPVARVHVNVAGGDGGHPQPLGQLREQPVAAAVVAPEGAL